MASEVENLYARYRSELKQHFSELWVFVKTIATGLFRSFCEWGLSTMA